MKKTLLTIALLCATPSTTQAHSSNDYVELATYCGISGIVNAGCTALIERLKPESQRHIKLVALTSSIAGFVSMPLAGVTKKAGFPIFLEFVGVYAPELYSLYQAAISKKLKMFITSDLSKKAMFCKLAIPLLRGALYMETLDTGQTR